jgi:hypothetical protein
MNAANYNWTEPINRASDKPGEIHGGPIEAFIMIQSFPRNSMNFDLVREHLYWMNQVMGVYPVV